MRYFFRLERNHCPGSWTLAALACVSLRMFAQEMPAAAPDRIAPLQMTGKIAFVSLVEKYWQIWVLDLSTNAVRQLTRSPIDKRTPSWTKEGDKIAYRTTAGALQIVSVESGEIEEVAPVLGFMVDPKLSPSGARVAFARFEPDPPDNTDIYVYTFASKALLRLTDDPKLDYGPAWSPNEKLIAYISGRGARGHHLNVMDADGKNKRELQPEPSDDMFPSFSPDGEWIVFSSSRTRDYEIWRVRPSGQDLQILTQSPGLDTHPIFAPDGSRIAFTSNRGGKLRIWTMKPDGSDCQSLTADSISARDPAWWQSQPLAETPKEKK